MTDPVIMARLTAIEARLGALEAGGGGSSAGAPAGKVRQEEPLEDHQLENAWADKPIKKDPKKWRGESQIGRTWSRAPAEWLLMAASSAEFKAHMGRLLPDDDPKKWVTNQTTGEKTIDSYTKQPKAWHESDTFNAKILRAWAKRNAANPPTEGDDDFNHGANAGADAAAKLDW